MLLKDSVKLSLAALFSQRMRSFLTTLGITVGIASVVLLTSLGEGVHRFVLSEFTQFGTNLIGVTPGKATTAGMSGGIISNVRPLSMDDAAALKRIPNIIAVAPVVQGNAAVEFGKRSRRTYIFGVGPQAPKVWQIRVAKGRFFTADDPSASRAFAVLGSKVKDDPKVLITFPARNKGEYYEITGKAELADERVTAKEL